MINPLTQKLAQEALKQAAKSAAVAGATAVLQRLVTVVPGTPGLILRGVVMAASVTAGYLTRS